MLVVILDIINKTGYKLVHKRIAGVIEKVLLEKGIKEGVELSVSLIGEQEMKKLHRRYMETSEVTDVLSFPLDETVFPDGIRRLGDVVVCLEAAAKQARENKKSLLRETEFLVDHGLRHLLGEHHE